MEGTIFAKGLAAPFILTTTCIGKVLLVHYLVLVVHVLVLNHIRPHVRYVVSGYTSPYQFNI